MTYTEIFILVFCSCVLPFLIVGVIALTAANVTIPQRQRKKKLSCEVLMCENKTIRAENRELRRENAILMQENRKLRGI